MPKVKPLLQFSDTTYVKLELYVYFNEDNVTMYQFWKPLLS